MHDTRFCVVAGRRRWLPAKGSSVCGRHGRLLLQHLVWWHVLSEFGLPSQPFLCLACLQHSKLLCGLAVSLYGLGLSTVHQSAVQAVLVALPGQETGNETGTGANDLQQTVCTSLGGTVVVLLPSAVDTSVPLLAAPPGEVCCAYYMYSR